MKFKLTTPVILWLSSAGIALLAVFMMVAALHSVSLHRQALKTVAKDSAPSIIAAQKMRAALSDMDANVANELLNPTASAEALSAYETRRKELANALIAASENVTFGDAERIPLQTLEFNLSSYERQAQSARLLPDRDRSRAAYRNAMTLMSVTLLPAAEALDIANRAELEKSYQQLTSSSAVSRFLLWFASACLLAALAWVQMFLNNRVRRRFNLPLLAATLVVIVFLLVVNAALSAGEHQLKVVKEDAFQSIHDLWRTLASAYDANADESRYLLDPANAAAYERDFFAKANNIAEIEKGQSIENWEPISKQTKGLLFDELRNITFAGEREAAMESIRTWVAYVKIDNKIRALNREGKTKEALELCIGSKPGQSNWAFEQFEKSVRKTIEINQSEFDKAADTGFSRLAGFEVITPVVTLLCALLGYFGLIVRIREYSA